MPPRPTTATVEEERRFWPELPIGAKLTFLEYLVGCMREIREKKDILVLIEI